MVQIVNFRKSWRTKKIKGKKDKRTIEDLILHNNNIEPSYTYLVMIIQYVSARWAIFFVYKNRRYESGGVILQRQSLF